LNGEKEEEGENAVGEEEIKPVFCRIKDTESVPSKPEEEKQILD
jgi:hypothetical protein